MQRSCCFFAYFFPFLFLFLPVLFMINWCGELCIPCKRGKTDQRALRTPVRIFSSDFFFFLVKSSMYVLKEKY